MKKLVFLLTFAFVITTTTMPSAHPNHNGQLVIVQGAEPDW